MAAQKLGFVGVGQMGGPMSLRLLDAGHELVVFDTSAAALKPLAARGATVAASAAEVASQTQTVLVSLPTPAPRSSLPTSRSGCCAWVTTADPTSGSPPPTRCGSRSPTPRSTS